ncbi:MAG: anti-sigma factor domain-containing protein [Gaiellaceae bacterium]
MSPNFDELVGAETTGEERERLRGVHELLLQAGLPAELPPHLREGPSLGAVRLQPRTVKRRALLLLAAALSIVAVFAAGYAVADQRGGSAKSATPLETLTLSGTSRAPHARATLEVWHARDGNWPMTLSVVGLPKLPRHTHYEVYLVRDGKPWGSCGTFRVSSSRALTLTLNAPYSLEQGDSWIVTRATPDGEPGKTVLHAVSA